MSATAMAATALRYEAAMWRSMYADDSAAVARVCCARLADDAGRTRSNRHDAELGPPVLGSRHRRRACR